MNLTEGIGCIVLRNHDRAPVLLLQRSFGEFENKWGFVGGTIESDESPYDTAVRELFEETGIRALPRKLDAIIQKDHKVIIHVFLAEVLGTPEVILDSENSASQWFSFNEAKNLLPLPEQKAALDLARPCTRISE